MLFIAVYFIAAVLPAVLLLRYIYRKDRVEKEPRRLLLFLMLMGALSAFIAHALETVGTLVLNAFPNRDSKVYVILFAFLVVAASEEAAKFIVLKKFTWRNPNFNYRFDGIVYSVFVSLGFAILENLIYIFSYGLSIALSRALLAVPAHMGFAVFLGIFYGRARQCENSGDKMGKDINLWLGYLIAVFLHGFYDATIMIGTAASTILFVVFVIAMYIITIHRIKKESLQDQPI